MTIHNLSCTAMMTISCRKLKRRKRIGRIAGLKPVIFSGCYSCSRLDRVPHLSGLGRRRGGPLARLSLPVTALVPIEAPSSILVFSVSHQYSN